jgi:hypothetical protein
VATSTNAICSLRLRYVILVNWITAERLFVGTLWLRKPRHMNQENSVLNR